MDVAERLLRVALVAAGMAASACSARGLGLSIDPVDRISIEHVEALFARAGLQPDVIAQGTHRNWGCAFGPASSAAARRVLLADAAWEDLSTRIHGEDFNRRLQHGVPRLVDVDIHDALAVLDRDGSPAAAVLRDPRVLEPDLPPGPTPRPARDWRVRRLTVFERRYVDAVGATRRGADVRVELVDPQGRWKRWSGQVVEQADGWELLMSDAAASDRPQ